MWDDVTAAIGDGYLVDGHLWMKVRETATASSPRWQDMGQIKGDKGDDSVTYTLAVDPSSVNFNTNAVGEFVGPSTITITATAVKHEGQKTPVVGNSGSYQVFVRTETTDTSTGAKTYSAWAGAYNSNTYTPNKSAAIAAATPVTAIQFKLAISDSGSAIATATVPVTLGGRRGQEGALGKMFYPMGEWVEQTYERTDDRVPLVHHGTAWNANLQVYGSYYYLSADSATAADVPGVSNKWTLCDDFGVVITQGLFAEFAKLGSAIMSGDYMFSMNGRIGSTNYEAGQTYTADGVTRPAYTWFKGDPSQQTGTFFEPNWWVNLKTGKMSAARGKFVVNDNGDTYTQGEVHATSGEFNGTVKAKQFYSPVVTDMQGLSVMYDSSAQAYRYTIDPENEPFSMLIFDSVGLCYIIKLPDPNVYEGLELSFYERKPRTMTQSTTVYISAPTDNTGLIKGIEKNTEGGNPYTGYSAYNQIVLGLESYLLLKAFGGYWNVIQGNHEYYAG